MTIRTRKMCVTIRTKMCHDYQNEDVSWLSERRCVMTIRTKMWRDYQNENVTWLSGRRCGLTIRKKMWRKQQNKDVTWLSELRYGVTIRTTMWCDYQNKMWRGYPNYDFIIAIAIDRSTSDVLRWSRTKLSSSSLVVMTIWDVSGRVNIVKFRVLLMFSPSWRWWPWFTIVGTATFYFIRELIF